MNILKDQWPRNGQVVHMLPGSGKTWLVDAYPEAFADGDVLYEIEFPGKWKGNVHNLSLAARKSALEQTGKTVLTNDHEVADLSVLHESVEDYLKRASAREDLDPAVLRKWYSDAVENLHPMLVVDPQAYVMRLKR